VKTGRWQTVIFIAKRQVVAVCMESPLYFTIPLRERLEFVKQLEQRVLLNRRLPAIAPGENILFTAK
jgi:hypothetical protein